NWHFIAARFKPGSEIMVQVDGVKKTAATSVSSINPAVIPFKIGSGAGDKKFNGLLDEVKVWNYALSDGEIKKEFEAIKVSTYVQTTKDNYFTDEIITITSATRLDISSEMPLEEISISQKPKDISIIETNIIPITKQSQLNQFNIKYGDEWQALLDEYTGRPTYLIGGSIPDIRSSQVMDINSDTLLFINENIEFLGIDSNNLFLISASQEPKHDPSLLTGIEQSTYQQHYQGIPVYGSFVSIGYINRALVSYQANYYDIQNINIQPLVTEQEAIIIAQELNSQYESGAIAEIIIYPNDLLNNDFRLAYLVELPLTINKLSKYNVVIDAHSGEILDNFDTIWYVVDGTVTGNILPEHTQQNFETVQIKDNTISIGSQTGLTNSAGFYSIQNNGAVTLNSILEGPWVDVFNSAKQRSKHTASLTAPTTHNWNWDSDDNSDRKEETNVFYHTNIIHDYFKNLGVNEIDRKFKATVHLPDKCNAYYTRDTINFYPSGSSSKGECENTALLSDVIYHEYTHGVVDHVITIPFPYWDETGNLNEAWSDYFAVSKNNNPCIAERFFKNKDCLRNSKNNNRWPKDYNPEPHTGSPIIAGSLWDLRELIGASLTDSLTIRAIRLQPNTFHKFMNNVIIADDDNGNPSDGTPHLKEICAAFEGHGLNSPFCPNQPPQPPQPPTPPSPKPLGSKIVNDYSTTISGLLTMKLQEKSGDQWKDVSLIITNRAINIQSGKFYSLDNGDNNNGWNNYDVSVVKPGIYRVVAEFSQSGEEISNFWIININPRPVVELSVSTTKEIYGINEQVDITGSSSFLSIQNIQTIPVNVLSETNTNNYQGHIVKFESLSIIEEKARIEEEAKKNEEYIQANPFLSTITGRRFFATRTEDVPIAVEKYSEKLKEEHKKIKDNIFSVLAKNP
ncbi:MAG: LamG-like jellyroll fold domain-containing protein, partial [Nanoarchaeota archaeon]